LFFHKFNSSNGVHTFRVYNYRAVKLSTLRLSSRGNWATKICRVIMGISPRRGCCSRSSRRYLRNCSGSDNDGKDYSKQFHSSTSFGLYCISRHLFLRAKIVEWILFWCAMGFYRQKISYQYTFKFFRLTKRKRQKYLKVDFLIEYIEQFWILKSLETPFRNGFFNLKLVFMSWIWFSRFRFILEKNSLSNIYIPNFD
jgi:hypothetical protein